MGEVAGSTRRNVKALLKEFFTDLPDGFAQGEQTNNIGRAKRQRPAASFAGSGPSETMTSADLQRNN